MLQSLLAVCIIAFLGGMLSESTPGIIGYYSLCMRYVSSRFTEREHTGDCRILQSLSLYDYDISLSEGTPGIVGCYRWLAL